MQVYLAAIAGYLPSAIIQCIATFMDACYIARCNAITGPALQHFRSCVEKFHALRNIFIQAGVRTSISLPRQHALDHYFYVICLFGSPNGLCSSITESKHMKEPWHRSSRYRALIQMLRILVRMDKMAALRHKFAEMGMLVGTTTSYMAQMKAEDLDEDVIAEEDEFCDNRDDNEEPMAGNPSGAMSDVKLTSRYGMSYTSSLFIFELMYLYNRTLLSPQSQSPYKIYKPAFVSLCSLSIPLPP